MLLKGYTKKFLRVENNSNIVSLYCFADLHEDIGEVLPFLKEVFDEAVYSDETPFISFTIRGKKIMVYPRKIVIYALKDEEEADKILEWLKREINEAWEKRAEIEPSYEGAPKPKVLEILKLLPKTNCRECGEPTCMVFAAKIAEGAKGPTDCPPLREEKRINLQKYMETFQLDV